ncbi:MAG: CopG family ribbon-helix-helix protein [Parachlamydiaceae bacterium]
MNFTVYVSKKTGDRIAKMAKSLQRSRNSIVAEALDEWLDRHVVPKWPKSFFDFPSVGEVPDFRSYRKELQAPSEDPLS